MESAASDRADQVDVLEEEQAVEERSVFCANAEVVDGVDHGVLQQVYVVVCTDVAACASLASNRSSDSSTSRCRICLDVETVEAAGDPILELGCKCSGGLGLAHKSCAVIWFTAKRSRSVAYEQLKCEICQCDLAPAVSLIVCQHSSAVQITIRGAQFPNHTSLQIAQVSVGSTDINTRRRLAEDPMTLAKIVGILVLLVVIVFHVFVIQAHQHS